MAKRRAKSKPAAPRWGELERRLRHAAGPLQREYPGLARDCEAAADLIAAVRRVLEWSVDDPGMLMMLSREIDKAMEGEVS